MEAERKYVLIHSRRGAVIGFALTGFICIEALRAIVSHARPEPDPIMSMFSWLVTLPRWGQAAISILFYGFYGWTIAVLCRAAQGKERILFAGWLVGMILVPVQHNVPVAFAPPIQYMKATAMGIATIAAFVMIWQTYPAFEVIPTRASKGQWFWVALIFIICAFMVIYYMPRGR